MVRNLSHNPLVFLFCFGFSLFVLNGCASPPQKRDYIIGYRETGLASWYGRDFHGRPTSSGEIYNMFGLSAAHKTFPLGTLLRVTGRGSGKSVEVKVNDRGPFVGERILDLSFGAAKALDIVEEGTAEVEIEVIGMSVISKRILPEGEGYVVQIGAYHLKENALRMKEKVSRFQNKVYLETYETNTQVFHRVRVGPFRSDSEARRAAGELSSKVSTEEEFLPVVIRAD